MHMKLSKQSQINVRENNLRVVLDTILKNEPVSRAEIMRMTHISKPTVSKLINELIERQLIYETGIVKSKLGRPAIQLKFNRTKKYLLVLDYGREECEIAISDLKGHILKKCTFSIDSNEKLEYNVKKIKDHVDVLFDQLHISIRDIMRSICTCPGIYVGKERGFIWYPGNIQDDDHDIHTVLQEKLNIDVVVEHSTKLSLLGEKKAGKAQEYNNVIYIDFGYGLGSSLLFNGEIYYGPFNSSGEIGYLYTHLNEFKKHVIQPYEHGPLCKKVSGKAIQEAGRLLLQQNRMTKLKELSKGKSDRITGKLVFHAAQENDRASIEILQEAFGHFNMSLCNIINVLTPELVIFGGGFTYAGDYLLHFIKDAIQDKVLFMPKMEISTLKKEASIIGGIYFLIESIDFLNDLG